MNNVVNQMPYLRTSREFPRDIIQISEAVSKAYIDIANKMNSRTIGIFPVNRPSITGEAWFNENNLKEQTIRQVFPITSFSAINHNLDFDNITTFTVIRGIVFDGTNYYPIPYPSNNSNLIVTIDITPTQITFTTGAGAMISSGFILLEWMTNVS